MRSTGCATGGPWRPGGPLARAALRADKRLAARLERVKVVRPADGPVYSRHRAEAEEFLRELVSAPTTLGAANDTQQRLPNDRPRTHQRFAPVFASYAVSRNDPGSRISVVPSGARSGLREAREVFEEGLHIPLARLVHAGRVDDTLVTLIRANVRTPEQTVGDIFAQVSALAIMGLLPRQNAVVEAGSRLEARAEDGSSLFDLAFAPSEIADLPGNQQSFVFAVPISDAAAARLTTLRLSGGGREAVRTALRPTPAQLPRGVKLATEARRVAPWAGCSVSVTCTAPFGRGPVTH